MEAVGERWTLFIVRDAFLSVRRFGDFAAHLSLPQAVLTDRLATLIRAGVLARVPGPASERCTNLSPSGWSCSRPYEPSLLGGEGRDCTTLPEDVVPAGSCATRRTAPPLRGTAAASAAASWSTYGTSCSLPVPGSPGPARPTTP
ncbi:winged helix-turn-helix transcriptional regulator [Streptomyces sp. NPDC057939]|uniref:winged helix-turn-helix transcriptional regulator n=1 Tax=Streptomyces sp. NPDC057939 TaxID=3346284 RepID=UPI0036EC309B